MIKVLTFAIVSEIHDILDLLPFQPSKTTPMGVRIYALIGDVIAVLPFHDLTALLDKKMETGRFVKILVTAIHSPICMVNIHCVWDVG